MNAENPKRSRSAGQLVQSPPWTTLKLSLVAAILNWVDGYEILTSVILVSKAFHTAVETVGTLYFADTLQALAVNYTEAYCECSNNRGYKCQRCNQQLALRKSAIDTWLIKWAPRIAQMGNSLLVDEDRTVSRFGQRLTHLVHTDVRLESVAHANFLMYQLPRLTSLNLTKYDVKHLKQLAETAKCPPWRSEPVTDTDIGNVLGVLLPRLRYLEFWAEDSLDLLLHHLNESSPLERLHLTNMNPKQRLTQIITSQIVDRKLLPNVRDLRVSLGTYWTLPQSEIYIQNVSALYTALGPQLNTLVCRLSPSSNHWHQCIASWKEMRQLNIADASLGEEDMKAFVHLSKLEELRFIETTIADGALTVNLPPSLKYLTWSVNRMDSYKWQDLLLDLRHLNALVTLSIKPIPYNAPSDQQMESIESGGPVDVKSIVNDIRYTEEPRLRPGTLRVRPPTNASQLRSLSLRGTGFADNDDFGWLAQMPLLVHVDLNDTNATDQALTQLANCAAVPLVETLCVDGTNVTVAGLAAVSRFARLRHLEYVILAPRCLHDDTDD